MVALPQLAPGLCPRNGFDGSSGRELWLRSMGVLQGLMGGGVVGWRVIGALVAAGEALRATIAEGLKESAAEREEAFAASAREGAIPLEFAPVPRWDERRAA